jgi:plasmid stabilization system protein ParE
MSREVSFHPGAEDDLNDLIDRYEKRSPGSRELVLVEMRRVIERLCLFPEAYRQIRPGVRQAVLTRIPLNVIYSPMPTGIVILAIPDPRRDPKMIAQLLEERRP